MNKSSFIVFNPQIFKLTFICRLYLSNVNSIRNYDFRGGINWSGLKTPLLQTFFMVGNRHLYKSQQKKTLWFGKDHLSKVRHLAMVWLRQPVKGLTGPLVVVKTRRHMYG